MGPKAGRVTITTTLIWYPTGTDAQPHTQTKRAELILLNLHSFLTLALALALALAPTLANGACFPNLAQFPNPNSSFDDNEFCPDQGNPPNEP